jgi:predicted ATP-dependent endonuclease of OLD family
MKLYSITIEGYRRFERKQSLQLDCRLIALLGPNEAGKTSILKLLQGFTDDDAPYAVSGAGQDLTRGKQFPQDQIIVSVKLLVEPGDLEAIASVHEASATRWAVVRKQVDGKKGIEIYPEITRNLSLRKAAKSQIEEVIASLEHSELAETELTELRKLLEQSLEIVSDETTPTFSAQQIQTLQSLRNTQRESRPVSDALALLISSESKEHPAITAGKILLTRVPQFVLFSEADRSLRSSYDLNSFFIANPRQPVPNALQNLAATAELSLSELFNSIQAKDEGKIETLLMTANAAIEQKITKGWNQANLTMRFRTNGSILSVVVKSPESQFEVISERSDGLRQFVALLAFLSRHAEIENSNDIVLLIDEAEIRLHYDAQADLVQMLARQTVARQVIYTTHSVGCLPEDLGLGVRLVHAETERTSIVVNRFWSQNLPGLSPVLIGMGAATMAFLPVRYCVLTEGASDMLMLPALLREASGQESLGFQIAPGLSEAGGRQISVLQNEGNRVW